LVAHIELRTWLRVFENRVLRRIFGPKRDEVTEEWRRLHNEELCDLYCSPYIVRVIKSKEGDGRGMYHVWETREIQTCFLWGSLNERAHLEDLGVNRRIIFKWIFKWWDAEARVGLIWVRTGTGGGLFPMRY